jgi:hypothetical protein
VTTSSVESLRSTFQLASAMLMYFGHLEANRFENGGRNRTGRPIHQLAARHSSSRETPSYKAFYYRSALKLLELIP